jgi:CRISPR system Cascade subunit CasD
MGKPVLMLRLEGPLQAWGGRSRWDVRDTQPEPTKSGVLGLLGCALGYSVGDQRLESELDAGLRFGVRVEAPGRVIQDYQTVTDYLPTAAGEYKGREEKRSKSLDRLRSDPEIGPATIISPRFYLEDASFLVALEETASPVDLLQRCASALLAPSWPLYLGRKACAATRPILEELTDRYDGIEQALRNHRWSWLGARGNKRQFRAGPPTHLRAYVECEPGATGAMARQDAVRTNAARQYGFRYTRRLPDIQFSDVASAEGGN